MSAEVPYGLTAAAAGATIAVSVALVTIAHRQGSGYPQAFRLMRGAVSLVLTLLGFFAVVHWWVIAPDGYVTREVDPFAMALSGIPTPDDVAIVSLCVLGGFLLCLVANSQVIYFIRPGETLTGCAGA